MAKYAARGSTGEAAAPPVAVAVVNAHAPDNEEL